MIDQTQIDRMVERANEAHAALSAMVETPGWKHLQESMSVRLAEMEREIVHSPMSPVEREAKRQRAIELKFLIGFAASEIARHKGTSERNGGKRMELRV